MKIGAYESLTAFDTAGSGSARWCVAQRDGRRVFLKQFLSPVLPASGNEALRRRQRERCEAFERRKSRLYTALSCVPGDSVAPVTDFFALDGHYYAASEYVADSVPTVETVLALPPRGKRDVLRALARCLGRLHAQGLVHADLKPEHVLLQPRGDEGYRVRLIDFDSGFLEDEPPGRDAEGDPSYLAPETYLRMTGADVPLTRKIDTFAFGALWHLLWTGEPPDTDAGYLCEAALSGAEIRLSPALPTPYRWAVQRALSADPARRPDDAELERLLAPPGEEAGGDRPVNGMSRLLKRDSLLF